MSGVKFVLSFSFCERGRVKRGRVRENEQS